VNPLQAIVGGFHRVGCRVQRAAQKLLKVTIALGHSWPSSALRSDAVPQAVWLLTAAAGSSGSHD